MPGIPTQFRTMMEGLLGSESPDFFDSLGKRTHGLRANTLKIHPERLKSLLPYPLNPLPWTGSGFWFDESEKGINFPRPGLHPFHAAGLFYLQDPSAMAVAALLQPRPGELVLDLCAAPGGKSSQIACLLEDKGILVANEVHQKRVWELAGNLERQGVRRAAVLNETPERLSQFLGPIFDRVLVDAPCSGEAMFVESEAARRDWSMKLVQSCSERQTRIMEVAAGLVRPGGVLAYSTCTFNPYENEAVIASFLIDHGQFEMLAVDRPPGCSAGRPDWLEKQTANPEIEHAVRIWPHLAAGQGHFIAVLRRETGELPPVKKASVTQAIPREMVDLLTRFRGESLGLIEPGIAASTGGTPSTLSNRLAREEVPGWCDKDQLRVVGSQLYWIPPGMPDQTGLRVIRPGWWLGSFHSGNHKRRLRFEPSHAMALGLASAEFNRKISWKVSDPQVIQFLKGDAISSQGDEGWSLVTVDGYPLGWGKAANKILKNHYPRGLRWN